MSRFRSYGTNFSVAVVLTLGSVCGTAGSAMAEEPRSSPDCVDGYHESGSDAMYKNCSDQVGKNIQIRFDPQSKSGGAPKRCVAPNDDMRLGDAKAADPESRVTGADYLGPC